MNEDGTCGYSFTSKGHFNDHLVVFHFNVELASGLTYEETPVIEALYRGKLTGFGTLRDTPEAAAERGLLEKLRIQWSHITGSLSSPSLPSPVALSLADQTRLPTLSPAQTLRQAAEAMWQQTRPWRTFFRRSIRCPSTKSFCANTSEADAIISANACTACTDDLEPRERASFWGSKPSRIGEPWVRACRHELLCWTCAERLDADWMMARWLVTNRCGGIASALSRLGILTAEEYVDTVDAATTTVVAYYGATFPVGRLACEMIDVAKRRGLARLGHAGERTSRWLAHAPRPRGLGMAMTWPHAAAALVVEVDQH